MGIKAQVLISEKEGHDAFGPNTLKYKKSVKPNPEVLLVTSYPPRECGIATYSQDLVKALENKFKRTFNLTICALESEKREYHYSSEVKYTFDTSYAPGYATLTKTINKNKSVKLVLVQHEFGFFRNNENDLINLLSNITKPLILVFHTVLPNPDENLKLKVRCIIEACKCIVVMTNNSKQILINDYDAFDDKIVVIAHGTHLVPHLEKETLKEKYELGGRKVLSTFGLLSNGKGIETTLKALSGIIKNHPKIIFLIIGITHPEIVQSEGEIYRETLESQVEEYNLYDNVKFINRYLQLPELLDYLQLTDIYLFTSLDPNQAVSGTLSYAISCGCPIISTPIPHAREILQDNSGSIIDFGNSQQLKEAVIELLNDEKRCLETSSKVLHQVAPSSWENAAIAHANLFERITEGLIKPEFRIPDINLNHLKKMTTDVGIIQFSKINNPDLNSGYTLDDNSRALIAMCMHYELTQEKADLNYIKIYFNFIKYCQLANGAFLNYVDEKEVFTRQNNETNLSDSNGRAIWALGYLYSKGHLFPKDMISQVKETIECSLSIAERMHSTRAMAFAIKGLYFFNQPSKNPSITNLIKLLTNRLIAMYRHESEPDWEWYESYLTYANSLLPEVMLYAFLETGDPNYKSVAKTTFNFLLNLTFKGNQIKVISNKTWLQKGSVAETHGEQPIDVAYTIITLKLFSEVFKEEKYSRKMKVAFNWFLGLNHLNQIVYNPCTGGCYDGLEATHVNLNQGAESTISYLIARLSIETLIKADKTDVAKKNNRKLVQSFNQ